MIWIPPSRTLALEALILLLALVTPSQSGAQRAAPEPMDLLRLQLEGEVPAASEWSTDFRTRLGEILTHHHREVVVEKCSTSLCIIETEPVQGEAPPALPAADDILGLASALIQVHVELAVDHRRLTVFARVAP